MTEREPFLLSSWTKLAEVKDQREAISVFIETASFAGEGEGPLRIL